MMHIDELNRVAENDETRAERIMQGFSPKTLNNILLSDNASETVQLLAESILDRDEFQQEFDEQFNDGDYTAHDSYTNAYA